VGRRGSTLQTDAKTLTPAAAEKLYDSKLKEKLAKGYRPGEDSAPLATQRGGPHVQESRDGKAYDRQPGTSYRPMLLNSVGPPEYALLCSIAGCWHVPDSQWGFFFPAGSSLNHHLAGKRFQQQIVIVHHRLRTFELRQVRR